MLDEYSSVRSEAAMREILQKIIGSSVGIQIVQSADNISRCSGVHIGNGRILTVQHALDENNNPEKIIISSGNILQTANIVGAIPGLDLLLLQSEKFEGSIQAAVVSNESDDNSFQPGKTLLYSPYFPQRRILSGPIVGRDIDCTKDTSPEFDPYSRFPQYNFVVQTMNNSVPGNSGAGMFNLCGELVGILRKGAQALDLNLQPTYPIALGVSSKALNEFK